MDLTLSHTGRWPKVLPLVYSDLVKSIVSTTYRDKPFYGLICTGNIGFC